MKRLIFLLVIFIYPSFLFSQKIIELGSLPEILSGSSGLEFSKSGNIWTINDHGKPVLYQLTKDSFTINKTVYLNNKIKDWEDLTSDDHGNFYIGDFGNNDNNRTDLKIYIIPDPDSIAEKIYTAKIIRFKLSDQKAFPPPKSELEFDIEAMIHFNGNIYLFSKSRGNPFKGQIKVYKLTDQPGEHIAQLKDTFYTGEGLMLENWITGATISQQNGILALLSHNKIFFFSCFKGDDFFNGNFEMLPLDHFSQKEAIDFDDTQGTYLITDELTMGILGGKIYSIAIPDSIYNCD